jgi:SAM-dependent methyltransferase
MFTLNKVVPWGRSFDEYGRMFALTDQDLEGTILGCGDGPASFNAEGTRRGLTIVSCDPLYRVDAAAIRTQIDSTYEQIMEQMRRNMSDYVWTTIPSLDALGHTRLQAMQTFLSDYDGGKAQRRYIDAELPTLPFDTASFDLAVCSHLLFLYSMQLTSEFHRAALDELCRVAREVRMFPLVELGGTPSPHVEPVRAHLVSRGFDVSIETVDYEFRRGANQMMRVLQR